jgi:VWFA-related protein
MKLVCRGVGIAVVLGVTNIHLTGTFAQDREQPPKPVAATDLVTMDFRAFSEGTIVGDLKPGDLTLKVDGRPRDIRTLQYVEAGPPAAGDPLAPPPPPAFGTNASSDGRAVLLVIENESLRPGTDREVLNAAGRFTKMLAANDRVAVITMPRGGVNLDFTTRHDKVVETLNRIAGQGSATSTPSDRACRSRLTLEALAELFNGLASSPGPKTVAFVSSGLLRPTRDAPLLGPPGQCEIKSEHFDNVGRAADAARIQFYAVRPEDLIVDPAQTSAISPAASRFASTDEEVAGLESLTGVADGVYLKLPRGDDSSFARIVRDTSGHYLLAFEPQGSERNGQSHRIELRTTRAGVTLDTRARLTIPKPQKSSTTPQAMLRDGKTYRDLPIRTAAFPSSNPGDSKLKVISLLEPVEPGVTLSAAAFGLINAKGTLVAQWTADDAALKRQPLMAAGLASPGEYRLRAAAVDTVGRRGVAEYDVRVELVEAAPVKLSAMALGTSRGGSFQPRLLFGNEPTAMGYFEIYGRPPAGTLTVALEIAESMDGTAITRVPGTIVPSADGDGATANGVVPIGGLATGDYVVRGIVSLDGRPVGRVARPLRKGAQ